MTRRGLSFATVLALLLGAGALVAVPPDVAEVPLPAPLDLIPVSLEGWKESGEALTDALPADDRAPQRLRRTYRNGTDTVWVAVGYYPAQSEGHRPPARQLLFPGSGWTHLSERRVRIPLGGGRDGAIDANLVLMETRTGALAILYWYQIQARSIASDHWYRARLLYNRLIHRRTDGALVRVASAIPKGTEGAVALGPQTDFLQAFYPELLRSLPR